MRGGPINKARALKIGWLVACGVVLVGVVIYKGEGDTQRFLKLDHASARLSAKPPCDTAGYCNRFSGPDDLTAGLTAGSTHADRSP